MKSFSNTYIFIFSSVMVIAVAAILSIVALQLKPIQEKNIRTEKIQNILSSVQIESTKKNADALFEKYITESVVVNAAGNKIEAEKAFDVDLKKEAAKMDKIKKLKSSLVKKEESPFKKFMSKYIAFEEVDSTSVLKEINKLEKEQRLPVYICKKDNKEFYIFPLRGKGLWGPIWGYISLEDNLNTIYGAVFDHKSETPGLGAEIQEDWFEKAFIGKQLFEASAFTSVAVKKGEVDPKDLHSVDAISGGTITSKGVEAMLADCLGSYLSYINSKRK